MFYSSVGIVFIHKTPGESLNFYYKKASHITDKLCTKHLLDNKMLTTSQVEKIYNLATKETSKSLLGCSYY